MLSASKAKIYSFLNGTSQYKIPFFQRRYVWGVNNWAEIWDNIIEEYNELASNPNSDSEHFIGTIIIKQLLSSQVGATEYELIDGQQRMTTICILLRALHDSTSEESAKKWIKKFLTFEDSYGNEKFRIIHSKVDREYFQSIIQCQKDNAELWENYKQLRLDELEKKLDTVTNIVGSYIYFRKKIEQECNVEDIRGYVNIVIERLPVIHMALNAEDDVQQIFDTINSLGVKLTTAELLKNYLYSDKEVAKNYEKYWYNVFEVDEDAIEFWNRDRTSGRIKRTTVELFLYSYLVILKESNVKMESLFKEFKMYLKNKTKDNLIAFAKDIYDFALVYQEMPDGENLAEISFSEHEKRFFHIIREFDINTILPLVLYIYKEVNDAAERINILNVLESYVTRRTICKLTTKNYNNLFITILGDLKEKETVNADEIKQILLKYTEQTNRFPDDEELKKAFHNTYLYNKYSREVLYAIALFHKTHEYHDDSKLNFNGFSVEHVMPKNWQNNWNTLPNDKTKEERSRKVLTLGNLTLVKGKLNSSMRDSSWSTKKAALKKFSALKQTVDYLEENPWNEKVIEKRADDLFDAALKIWKR